MGRIGHEEMQPKQVYKAQQQYYIDQAINNKEVEVFYAASKIKHRKQREKDYSQPQAYMSPLIKQLTDFYFKRNEC
jgi:hypothetical protein